MAQASPKKHPTWIDLLKRTFSAWTDDYAASMGAALSYYSVFSMGPLLLIIISVAGLVFGQEAVRGELFGQLRSMMGDEAAKGVQALLAGVSKPEHGVIGATVGVVVLVLGATTVFGELQDALDRIWRAPAREGGSGLWGLVRARFLSFGMILGIAFLLVVSLVASAAVAALGKWWGSAFGSWEVLGQLVNQVIGFAVTLVAFALIYKLMPRVSVAWGDVWTGAAVTSGLFTVGKFLIGLYIGKTGVASGFGAAGSIAVIFVWVYYSAQIFLLGAEFTWVYAKSYGSLKDQDDVVPAAEPPAPSPVSSPDTLEPAKVSEPARDSGRDDGPVADQHRPAVRYGDVAIVGAALVLALWIRSRRRKLVSAKLAARALRHLVRDAAAPQPGRHQ